MAIQPLPTLSLEEYLELERRADHKSEYFEGHAVAMAGASYDHNLIVANVVGALWSRLRDKPCAVMPSDLKVQATTRVYYPDVTVVCGDPEFLDGTRDVCLNPRIVVEVLSETTQNFDRGEKFLRYRMVESLTDYLLIAQSTIHVEHFRRQEDLWVLSETRSRRGRVVLESIGCELELAEIYDRLELPAGP